MRLESDEIIDSMPLDAVRSTLSDLGELNSEVSDQHGALKKLQRSRKLVLWHDHSTIVGSGYILMTIHII